MCYHTDKEQNTSEYIEALLFDIEAILELAYRHADLFESPMEE